MLTIVQRGGATREKPPEVVRGAASRLPWAWDGLCFAVPFNDSTRDSAREIVANVAPSEWVGTPGWAKDNRGNVAAALGTDTYMGYPEDPRHNRPSTALTVYIRLRRTAATAITPAICGKVYSPTNDAPWTTWSLNASDTDASKFAGSITVGGLNYWIDSTSQTYTSDTATWLSIFLRWASGTAPAIQVMGERGQVYQTLDLGSTVTGSLSYPGTPQPLRLNTSSGPASGTYQAHWSQMLVWSRRLTDTEVQALVSDPYGWYSPRRETVGLSSPYPLFGGQSFMREVPSG